MMHAHTWEAGLGVIELTLADERELVARCVKGERAAQRAFIERYKGFIFRIALKVTRNHHAAEDLSQEAFLKILDKLESFKGETPVETWLYRVTMNHCLDHLRRVNARRTVELDEGADGPVDEGASPEATLLDRELAGAVGRALAELPPKFRLAYTLHHWEDLSYEDIARMEKTSVSAIKMRIARGREQLVQKLRGWFEKEVP